MPTYDSGPSKEVQGRPGNPRDLIIISRLGEAAGSVSYIAGSIFDASV